MDEDDLFNPYGSGGSVRDPIPGYFGAGGSVSVPGSYSDPSLDPGAETVSAGGGYTEQTMVATGPVYRIAPKDEPDRTLLYVGGGLLLVAALYAVTR